MWASCLIPSVRGRLRVFGCFCIGLIRFIVSFALMSDELTLAELDDAKQRLLGLFQLVAEREAEEALGPDWAMQAATPKTTAPHAQSKSGAAAKKMPLRTLTKKAASFSSGQRPWQDTKGQEVLGVSELAAPGAQSKDKKPLRTPSRSPKRSVDNRVRKSPSPVRSVPRIPWRRLDESSFPVAAQPPRRWPKEDVVSRLRILHHALRQTLAQSAAQSKTASVETPCWTWNTWSPEQRPALTRAQNTWTKTETPTPRRRPSQVLRRGNPEFHPLA